MSHHKRVNVALLGCGAVVQRYHAPALEQLERESLVQVQALFDPDRANLSSLRKRFPGAAAVDFHAFEEVGIDLAIVASPPRFHAEQTIRLLDSGIAVLCEKPMATSRAEGEAMIAAAERSQGILAIGLYRRFLPAAQAIRDILTCGLLGELHGFSCYEGGAFKWPVQSASYFQRENAGGGVLLDLGVHTVDLLLWWLGWPEQVFYEDDAMGGIEANCRLHLQYPNGVEGTVRLSRDWEQPNHYEFRCSRGSLRWTNIEANRIEVKLEESNYLLDSKLLQREGASPFAPAQQASTFQQSFVNQMRNMLAAMEGTAMLHVPGTEAIRSLTLIEECYHHRTLIPMHWLSDLEILRAQQLAAGTPCCHE